MGTLNRVLNGFIKLVFVVVGLAVAVVPGVYIFGHEAVWRQEWSSGLERFSGRAGQAEQLAGHALSNVFLHADAAKLTWADVNATLDLANYLHHQLQSGGVTVVRRLLEFKKPVAGKKGKAKEQAEEVEFEVSNQVAEVPPLRWLKDLLEPYVAFEHESLKRKHWIIVCLGELDGKVANDIENLQKKNGQYRVTLVSPWPISSKLVDITPLPYEGVPEVLESEEGKAVQERRGKEEKAKEEGKREGKFKVKQVKQIKTEKGAGNSSQAQEL